jgi:hypothetical protein
MLNSRTRVYRALGGDIERPGPSTVSSASGVLFRRTFFVRTCQPIREGSLPRSGFSALLISVEGCAPLWRPLVLRPGPFMFTLEVWSMGLRAERRKACLGRCEGQEISGDFGLFVTLLVS